jgi:capsular exopolysaccharide synthesis family protein
MNMHVLEAAQPEDKPSKPARVPTMGLGLALGVMLGIGLALIKEMRDGRLHSAEEIYATLELPLLGVIPHMPGRNMRGQKALMVHTQPMSEVAEAYRTVRTAVYFGVPGGRARTLLVTSPEAGDGKTTSASNLAIAMAQAGQRVLLLDADFRKPVQHVIYAMADDAGLSSLLRGTCNLEQAIQRSPIDNLDILPCGPMPANPAELLQGRVFADLLCALREQYDSVLIDSPPGGAVADARILSTVADATILVLRARSSTRQAAQYAHDSLRRVGGRIVGVIVNDVPTRRGHYGYYAPYSKYRKAGIGMIGGANGQSIMVQRHDGEQGAMKDFHRKEGTDP